MIDPRTPRSKIEAAHDLELDWRNAYLGPDTEGRLVAWPLGAAEALDVLPLEERGPGLVLSPAEPLREGAAHTAPLLSELWMGEFVRRLSEADGWWLVADEDGYVGWMRAWASRPTSQGEKEELLHRRGACFTPPTGWLLDENGRPCAPLMGGSPLLDLELEGPLARVRTVDGIRGRVPSESIERRPPPGDVASIYDAARPLLGSSYRWGGRTPGGIDCSGLVQWAALRAGFELPRDAVQQSRVGRAVESSPGSWQRGDLLFFHDPVDHVGIFDGEGQLLHARARVRKQALEEIGELMEGLQGVRRLEREQHIDHSTLWRRPPLASQ